MQRPEEREAVLDAACGADSSLRRDVERLLAADAQMATLEDEELGDGDGHPEPRASGISADELLGQRFGAYRIEKEIGRGGMATVYLATRADEEYLRKVAIKIIPRESAR